MSTPAKPTSDVARWNRAVRDAHFPDPACPAPLPGEIDELTATDAEIDAHLRAAGVDMEELDALADETYERAKAKFGGGAAGLAFARGGPAEDAEAESSAAWVAPSTPELPIRTGPIRTGKRRSPATWLAYAAAAAAATTGGAYILATHQPKEERGKRVVVFFHA